MGGSLTSENKASNNVDDITIVLDGIKKATCKAYVPIEDRAQKYIDRLHVPTDQLRSTVDSFVHELEVGLEAHKRNPFKWIPSECSFKMIDSYVPQLPTGKETGVYYAMDFGGCNFRVIRAELEGKGNIEVSMQQQSLHNLTQGSNSKKLLSAQTTAKELFDTFAISMKNFLETHPEGKAGQQIPVGFTFSFPCIQRAINKAVLVYWTKEISTGRDTNDPVEGLDAVELMNAAFIRNQVSMRCSVVLNDTIAVMLCGAYIVDRSLQPPCLVGLILGTGMNCCYYDESAPSYGYTGKIINLECGNFNRDLPRIDIDCELDFKAIDSRGFQHLEKMCSAAYLGELCRLVIIKVFAEQTPPMAWKAYTLTTDTLARIVDDKSEDYVVTSQEIMRLWQVEMPLEHLMILHRLATAVIERSCALAAVLIAGCAKKTGRLRPAFGGLSVGIDGSLYTKNPFYQKRLRYHLDNILGADLGSLIELLSVEDGSGKGAAILAAMNDFS